MQRVAIIGSEQSKLEARKAATNVEEMIYETVRSLLDKTGIDIREVETVIGAGDDVLDGRSISNVFTADYAGAFLKEESKVEQDGAFAALYAFMRIASGAFDTALVYGYSKASDSSPSYYSGLIADPFYLRPLGIDAITAAALQAQVYFQTHGISEKQAALVAVKSRGNALSNRYLDLDRELTMDEVLSSPALALPIRELDASPATDGCCAMLLASETTAGKLSRNPVWITGVGFATDSYYPGYRDLGSLKSASIAAVRAYKMAGITDARSQIGLAEVHASFSYQELMLYEALGFCPSGMGGEFISQGSEFKAVTPLPVNLSGGPLSADPIFATGLIRLAEAAERLTDYPEIDSSAPRLAVAHAASGFCMQSNAVFVLSQEYANVC